jgi:hypothetical protein
MWNFKENEAVETDSIDVKSFKPAGKFYEDVDSLCKTFHVKAHPALRNPHQPSGEGSEEVKEVSQITINKHRIDRNSMRVLFFSLPASPNIQTLK